MIYPKNWEFLYALYEKKEITAVEFMNRSGLKPGVFYNLLKHYTLEKKRNPKIVYKEVGECVELYISNEYIKTFNAFPEAYQNRIDAEEYVKNLNTLMLKLSEAEQSIRKSGTISADELELDLTE